MTVQDHSTDKASVSDPIDDIASLLMGDDDSGEEAEADPTKNQTQDTPDTDDTDGAEELPDESTEVDEVDESAAATDDSEEGDQTLAEMLGVDESQLTVLDDGSFKLNVKVDGQQSQHSLADVLKNYQTESSVTNKSKALSDERKKFEDAVATKAVEIKQTLELNHRLAQVLQEEIVSEFQSVDWEDLREFNPAEWSAKRQELGAKYQKIQRVQAELGQQTAENMTQAKQQATAKRQVYLKGQWDEMLSNNPSWGDTTLYDKDMGAMREFATKTYGFSDADFATVVDARVIEMVKDAQAYRKGKSIAEKKVIKLPKMQKRGGARKAPKVSKLEKLTKAAKRASGANKRQLQTDAVAELLTGG